MNPIKNMYELPKVYGNNENKIVLPKNMYEMKPIYDHNINEQINGLNDKNLAKSLTNLLLNIDDFGDNVSNLNPLEDLLSRQHLLLSRIEDLEKDIDSRLHLKINEKNTIRIDSEKDSNVRKKEKNVLNTCSVKVNDEVMKSVIDIVIFSNVNQMPISVFAVINSMKSLGLKVMLNIHNHSSLKTNTDSHLDHFNAILSSIDLNYKNNRVNSRLENDLIVTIIFKDIDEHEMIVSPLDLIPILSEANILRFVARIAAQLKPELSYLYEGITDISRLTLVDNFIDEIQHKLFVNSIIDTKYVSELDSVLMANNYLTGNSPSIADLLLWSALNRKTSETKLSPALQKWFINTKKYISTQVF